MGNVIPIIASVAGGFLTNELFGGSSKPKAPTIVLPPPPVIPDAPVPTDFDDPRIAQARKDERRRRRSGGRQSTILGGSVGSDQNLGTNTLLGGG